MSAENTASYGTQSIGRAAMVLRTLSRHADGARLTDVARETKLTKPTVHRILAALIRAGLVEQDSFRENYFLGPEVFILGVIAASRHDVERIAGPALARLAEVSQDSTFLSVVRGFDVIFVQCEEGSWPIRSHVLRVGDRYPLGLSSAGQAILAAMDDEAVERVIAANGKRMAERYPNYTLPRIRRLIADARATGYALNDGLIWPGSWGIGVAVYDAGGRPVAALNITAVESRMQPARQEELAAALMREAKYLSGQLGRAAKLLQDRRYEAHLD